MRLSFTVDGFNVFPMELDADLELENVKALIQEETGIPVDAQQLLYNGVPLEDVKKSLRQYNVLEDEIILVRKVAKKLKMDNPAIARAETVRQNILSNPQVAADVGRKNPRLLEAARNDPTTFYRMLDELEKAAREQSLRYEAEMERLNADPFDVEAQRKIEEMIHKQNIDNNMELAMEVAPESFARVFMLYINCEINGIKAKAFVDSGAQMTIMSSTFAEKCGLTRLMDTRWSGIAKGVGTAKIVGRVHMAQLKIENVFLPCSFTILENQPMDILFGLDMLRRHHCVIDLGKNTLKIGDIETSFLGESEIPKDFEGEDDRSKQNTLASTSAPTPATLTSPTSSSTLPKPTSSPQPTAARQPTPSTSPFQMPQLQLPTNLPPQPSQPPPPAQTQQSQFPEDHITVLMNFGASRQQAIQALTAAGGNVDVAASFLFP